MTATTTCENCRYWVRVDDSALGACRRFPPMPWVSKDHDTAGVAPLTDGNWWCGEWASRRQDA